MRELSLIVSVLQMKCTTCFQLERGRQYEHVFQSRVLKDEQYARCIWRYQIGFCFDSYQDNVLKFWISLTKCGLDMFPLADEITIRPWCIVEELKIRYTVRFVVNTATSTVH